MPTVTATFHQVLRYFFVGAIALFLVSFLTITTHACEPWTARLTRVAGSLATPGAVGLMLVGGSVIYGIHRVLIYPWLHLGVIVSIYGRAETGLSIWRCLLPHGAVTSPDVKLEVSRLGQPQMENRQRERFVGWASELHVLYTALEVGLVTLWRPGWSLGPYATSIAVPVLFGLGALVWAWDRQVVLLEKRVIESFPGPSVSTPTS